MADQAGQVEVRIFFKTEDGPRSFGQYRFTADVFKRLREQLEGHISRGAFNGGSYECEVSRDDHSRYEPTVLILRFSDVLCIG